MSSLPGSTELSDQNHVSITSCVCDDLFSKIHNEFSPQLVVCVVYIHLNFKNSYAISDNRFFIAESTSASWKYRRLCCIPYIVIYFVTIACILTMSILAVRFGFHEFHPFSSSDKSDSVSTGEVDAVLPTIDGIGEEDQVDDDDDVSRDSNEEAVNTDDEHDPFE